MDVGCFDFSALVLVQDQKGNFLWPGFGENLRVLQWIIKRREGEVGAKEGAIGYFAKF